MGTQHHTYIPHYRCAGDVNNQLGMLYAWLRYHCPLQKYLNMDRFDTTPLINNIFYYDNVVPVKLAKKCRQFLNDILFKDAPLFNDILNPPNKNVYNDLTDPYLTNEAVVNAMYDPSKWVWEKYNHQFYRASPLTKEAFVGSPIVDLFDYLTFKFYNTTDTFKKLKYSSWVIQLVPEGEHISIHMDDDGSRQIAFIYYLTPDNVTDNDGGQLTCYDCQTKQFLSSFKPIFNTLVMWDMTQHLGPLHNVNTVNMSNRIALVGFYVK